jgi:hypothetical protein
MAETILRGCDDGRNKWHWYSVMSDLENAGYPGITIDPLTGGQGGNTPDGNRFYMTWAPNTYFLITLVDRPDNKLIEAFSKVLEYRPFCKYQDSAHGQSIGTTYEWDKMDPEGRFNELVRNGKNPERIIYEKEGGERECKTIF